MRRLLIAICFIIPLGIYSQNTSPLIPNSDIKTYQDLWKTTYNSIKAAILLRDTSVLDRLTQLSVFAKWISIKNPEVVISPQRFIIDSNGNLSVESNHVVTLSWKNPVTTTNLLNISMTVTNILQKEKDVIPVLSIGLSSGIAFTFGDDASLYPYVAPVIKFHVIGPLYLDLGICGFWDKIGACGGISIALQKKMFYSLNYLCSVYDDKFHSFVAMGLTFDLW